MSILVTGAAGFIGYHLCERLLASGEKVIAIDNINDYYDVSLKEDRLKNLSKYNDFSFFKEDISDKNAIDLIVKDNPDIDQVVHLAAQAGVRYSIENPFAYVESNLVGHMVMLEVCRNLPNLKHFVYASSSSVYGGNEKVPFSVKDRVDNPLSLYAATKKADELMTHSYSHLYGIPSTGLRFFTVYGPWGRPDMAPFIFTKAILNNQPINVFNNGDMRRDFTYIDDIIDGTIKALARPPVNKPAYKIYNLGCNNSVDLMDFISHIEKCSGKTAQKNFKPMQAGDVKCTYADISETILDLGYKPEVGVGVGVKRFVDWFKRYYEIS